MPSALLQVYDSGGHTVFDSQAVKGGVIAGVYTYAASASGTLTFPAFAGYTPFLVHLVNSPNTAQPTVDTTLGYPRVTVPSAGVARVFIVAVK